MLSSTLSFKFKVQDLENKMTTADIEAAAVPEHAAQLSRYLYLRSEGHANTIAQASSDREEHPLETWRALSWDYDPKGLGQNSSS